MSKFATTGDGILTAIKIMEAVISSKMPLSKLAEPVRMLPQVMKNVRVADKAAVRNNARVQKSVEDVRVKLGDTGRILLRESGTEPVIRVMVEASTEGICRTCVDEVIDVIRTEGLA